MSLPLWECGLKWPNQNAYYRQQEMSLPLWEWGLKKSNVLLHCLECRRHSPCGSVDWNKGKYKPHKLYDVTPLVGVWIEICPISITEDQIKSLPLWECGLKYLILDGAILKRCHSPCGSVDWNTTCISRFEFTTVTPLVGVWIEIKTAIARLTCR